MAGEWLFPEMENSVEPVPEVGGKPKSDPWLEEFYKEAEKKGTVIAIEEFSSIALTEDDHLFLHEAEDEKLKLRASAKIANPTTSEERERLSLVLDLIEKTTLPYALNWIKKECDAMFVPTNEDESPYQSRERAA